ncbi:MAG: HEAT repeat domain-containing protein [Armatimonadota bacterium]
MSRWLVVLSLVLGCALLYQASWMATPAYAADDEVVVTMEGTEGDDGATEATPAADADEPEATDTASAQPFPTKALIRDMVEQGKSNEAEAAYLEWASYWQDDDPRLIIYVLRNKLMDDYRNGNNAALIALAQSGDREAANVLSQQVLSSGESWPPSDLIPAIHFIGRNGDKGVLNVLRSVLYNEDSGVVNAAIEALGDLGDARVASELMKLFEDADPERSMVLARALAKLGKAKQVSARFVPQLQFPLPGVREKAALVLAAIGQPKGWPLVHHMLQAKEAPYYPLAIVALSSLPTEESAAYVSAALVGEEEEQLAALASINVLPAEKINAALLTIMRDEARPASVRVQAIRMITARRIDAVGELRKLATKLAGEDPVVKGEAMMALATFNLLSEYPVREVVRQRITSEEEPVARASRALLLSYALKEANLLGIKNK